MEAYELLAKIGREDLKAAEASEALGAKIESIGIPPQYTGGGQAPYDIVGDYFRGTMAMLTDQLEYADEIEVLCDRMADIQIEGWQYFKYVDMPVKSVFFPLHKGMDGFMSPEIYHRLYWKPLKKCVEALVDMGVTPYLYTEGKYDSRLEQLTDVPKGKVVYHFESVDIQRAKQVLGGTACISGNLPLYTLEYGTPQQVIDETKRLIDICAPGGGYMFDAAGSLDNVPRANVEALFDTVQTYGKK